ncbi:MAG: Gx transporter family protein [Candidatus Fermentibacteraceae bacterium]|nr:Gx transporter family protein [Candidatus Fermentibacteraceae bacterium]MBN2607643.1 Gx transporter family protein [Candidatus Fermentibacteraceae bacterium]
MTERTDNADGRLKAEVLMVVLATGAGVIENLLPRPVPFIKPGLANIVTVAAVARYGMLTGLRVNILRTTGAALFTGSLATPTYVLSLAGGVASAMVMGASRRLLSVTGISVAGSLASLWIQLVLASVLLPGLPAASILLPLSVWGFLSGAVTGIIAAVLLRKGFPWMPGTGVDSAGSRT